MDDSGFVLALCSRVGWITYKYANYAQFITCEGSMESISIRCMAELGAHGQGKRMIVALIRFRTGWANSYVIPVRKSWSYFAQNNCGTMVSENP